MITAAVTAGAPAIAHGVQHALFAHNSDKVDNGSGPTATFTAAPGTHTYELRVRTFGNATDAMNVDNARMTAQTVPFNESGGTPSPARAQSEGSASRPASRR